MKKTLLAAMFAIGFGATAQETTDSVDQCRFVVVYDYKCNTQDKDGNAVTDSTRWAVMVGKRVTKCGEFNGIMMNDFKDWRNKDYQYGEWYARPFNIPIFYINHPEGEMNVFDKIVPQRYHVSGKLEKIDWKISDDTLTVGGYLCRKATGDYAGRKWNVWFTEEIASSAGPWKLRGLPGMILKAEDSKSIHSFEFSGLINRQTAIRYDIPHKKHTSHIPIDVEKFVKQRNKVMCNKRYADNPRYYIPDGALDGAIEMWGGGPEPPAEEKYTVLGPDMIAPKKAHVYQPLELK